MRIIRQSWETSKITSREHSYAIYDCTGDGISDCITVKAIVICLQQLYRKKPGMTMNSARLTENLSKNRYKDISPCK